MVSINQESVLSSFSASLRLSQRFFVFFLFREFSFYFFLLMLVTEKILFLGQIFEMEILMDLHVMRTPESENHIFSVWSVCACVCASVCDCKVNIWRFISTKIINIETPNFMHNTRLVDR